MPVPSRARAPHRMIVDSEMRTECVFSEAFGSAMGAPSRLAPGCGPVAGVGVAALRDGAAEEFAPGPVASGDKAYAGVMVPSARGVGSKETHPIEANHASGQACASLLVIR